MFTSYEKDGALTALLTVASTGKLHSDLEAERLREAMNDLQGYYSRLQSRAALLLADFNRVEVNPEHWADCETEAHAELMYPINIAMDGPLSPYGYDPAVNRLSYCEVAA